MPSLFAGYPVGPAAAGGEAERAQRAPNIGSPLATGSGAAGGSPAGGGWTPRTGQHIRKAYSLSGRTILAAGPHPPSGAGSSPSVGGGVPAPHSGRRPHSPLHSPLHSHALADVGLNAGGSPGPAGPWARAPPGWLRHALPPGHEGHAAGLAREGSGPGTDGFGSDLDADDSGAYEELVLEEEEEEDGELEAGMERIPDLGLGDEEDGRGEGGGGGEERRGQGGGLGAAPLANGGGPGPAGHSGRAANGPKPMDAAVGGAGAEGIGGWQAGGVRSPVRRRGRRGRMRPSGSGAGGGGSAFGAGGVSLDDEAGPAGVWASAVPPGMAEAEALQSHLSCASLTSVSGADRRKPIFYPEELLLSWEWDFTELRGEELVKLAYDVFLVSGLVEELDLRPKVLRNFLTAVASHYHAHVPYHNFNHVVHVMHASFLIAHTTRAAQLLPPLERLSLLLAALCHDMDHDGHSNSFHVNTGSELARIYNDQSVMENHHCAMSFAVLSRPDAALLAHLSAEAQRSARRAIIAAILCTDMANHFKITQDFQKHPLSFDPNSEADRLLLLKVILHAADIGNAVRPFAVNQAMSRRVHREFESQAAEEVRLGLPVTMAVDTSDAVMCARVELNFLDYVVAALWERLVEVLPELGPRLEALRANRARYRRIADGACTLEQALAEAEAEARQAAQQAKASQRQPGSPSAAAPGGQEGWQVPGGRPPDALPPGGVDETHDGHGARTMSVDAPSGNAS